MEVKVSIIIPVYNKEHSIEKCIQSLQKQSLKDIECIFVDDCSKDASIDYIKKSMATDSRIKLICSEENEGPMYARMHGYMAAKGQYIMFCDADDLIPLDGVEKLYRYINQGAFEIVVGNHDKIESNGTIHIQKNSLPFGKERENVFKALLSWKLSQSLCGKIYRRDLFTEDLVAVKNQKNGEDGWLLYQLVDKCSRLDLIDEVVYHYVMDEKSTTHQRFSEETLERVIRSNMSRVLIASKYNECASFAYRHLIMNKFRWIESGYDKQFINNVLVKYGDGLTITSIRNIFRYFSLVEITIMFLRRIIKRKL